MHIPMRPNRALLVAAALALASATTGAAAPPAASAPASAASTAASAPALPALDGYLLLRLSDAGAVLQQASPPKSAAEPDGLATLATVLAAWAWPAAALIGLLMLLRAPQVQLLLDRLPRHLTQINVAGLEFKLSAGAQAALSDLEKLIGQVPETYRDWIGSSNVDGQFQLVVADIKTYMSTDSLEFGTKLDRDDFNQFRFTLHVPDVILEHSLRQLVDYAGCDRGKAGRVFSMRTGIIGKAWRMEQSQFVADNTYDEDDLVEIWGMTRPEARDTSSRRKEHLAVLIRSPQGLPLALLYGDARAPGTELFDHTRLNGRSPAQAFSNFERAVTKACQDRGLVQSLQELDLQRRRIRQLDPYRASHQRA
jgi:hypothetical protein